MEREPEQITDEWLVLSAQTGSRAALDALVRRWQPRLLAHARQVTGQAETAKDVVQEAWLSILRSLGKLRDPAAFRGWAYRIVHHRAVDAVRRSKRRRESEDELRHITTQPDQEPPVESAEKREQLSSAISVLEPEQKLLLRMYYLDRMRIQEIAQVLETPTGTIKYRLFQLRQQLKTLMEGERHEP